MPEQGSAADPIGVDGEVATRVFSAARELVFEAWTKAEHFTRWFGPYGADILHCEINARPGGVIRFAHRFDDGATLYVAGTFREVVANERLEFKLGFVDEDGRPGRHPMFADWPLDAVIETTVILEDVEHSTRVTVRQRVTPASTASHAAVPHERRLARDGWTQVLARLSEHLHATPTGKKQQT